MDNVFELPEQLESINFGVNRYDMVQMYPTTGAINGATVGTGAASGLSTFQWQDSVNWWSPNQSYFHMQLTFINNAVTPIPTRPLTYCDNFIMTLFTQIQSYIDSRPLDVVNVPHIIDTALTYSNAKQNFIKTWGSLTRIGEALSTRLRNVQTNGGVVEVVFRPPLSIFDAKLLPPGAQFRIDYNWAANGLLAFESVFRSVGWGATAVTTDVSITVNSFSFYKATVQPSPMVSLPQKGVVDLMPSSINQYFLNGTNAIRQNLTFPGTTNRVLICCQDVNTAAVTTTPPVNLITGVGSGYQPATSFTAVFTNVGTANPNFTNTVQINQLYLSIPEIASTQPQPIYNFNNGVVDFMRAYSDFCHITQGTKNQDEGSVPFGNFYPTNGTTIISIDTDVGSSGTVLETPFFQQGDLNNPQQYLYMTSGATPADPDTYNQTARWGWLGRCPGPIFAFPIVRPENKPISTGTLNLTTSGNVQNASISVIATYSMAIVVELQPNGQYRYSLIEGV